jgi:predicted nuclease of predicted toxin-antitoxin system
LYLGWSKTRAYRCRIQCYELAFTENRILITLDKDFGELAVFRGKPHYGIIRIVNFSAIKHGEVSIKLLEAYKAELERNAILTVEKNRVRIRLAEF